MGPIMCQLSWEDHFWPLPMQSSIAEMESLTFGNMTLELNIFHLSNKHKLVENGNQGTDEVCSVNPNTEKPNVSKLQRLAMENEAIDWEFSASATTAEQLVSPKSPSEKKIDKNRPSMKAAAQATAGVKELLLLDPP